MGVGSAHADEDDRPFARDLELGLFAGGFISNYYHQFYDIDLFPTGREELERVSPEVGARFAYLPSDYFGGEVETWITFADTKQSDLPARLYGLRAHLVAQLPARVTPFAVLGWGLHAIHSAETTLGNDVDFPLHAGLGAKFWATESVAVRADVRLIRGPSSKDPYTLDASYGEFLLGVSWAPDLGSGPPPAPPDPDGDGVLGDADLCPDVAAQTPDGCPAAKDSDGDGFTDDVDNCPDGPETVNSWEDDDGCPDEVPDFDSDGIDDVKDACKSRAEDKDGFEDEDGCPEPDNDGDGVMDEADKCPDEAGPPANNGCPDTDSDGDGVVDRQDNCPQEAGTADNHGCKKKQLVTITKDQLKILDKVHFRTNRATIQRRSRPLLNNIAQVLEAHPEITRVRVEGHTDDRGPNEKNKTLSQARAEAVVDYLVERGIDRNRLEPIGFGEEHPLGDNTTRQGREANRRVEFNIVQE